MKTIKKTAWSFLETTKPWQTMVDDLVHQLQTNPPPGPAPRKGMGPPEACTKMASENVNSRVCHACVMRALHGYIYIYIYVTACANARTVRALYAIGVICNISVYAIGRCTM